MQNESSREHLMRGMPKPFWIVGAVLTVVGTAAFALQLAGQSMAGSSQYPWGFYIALFYTLASAGAGLLVVSGIARIGRLMNGDLMATLYAIACALFVAASVLIVVDLGFPQGVMMTYASANPASPVFFDAIVLPLCIAFTIAAALLARNRSAGMPVAAIGVVAGLALLAVEAWLLTTCSGKDAWGVLLGAGPALIQSCTIAVAVVAALVPSSRPWRALLAAAALITTASLVFDVVLNAGSGTVLASQFSAIAAHPLFWIGAACAVAAAIVALAAPAASALAVRIAAALAVVAVPLFKLAIFWGTQSIAAIPELEAPGAAPFEPLELVVFAGAVGLGMLVYAVAAKVLASRASQTATDAAAASAAAQTAPSVPASTEEVHV